MCNTVQLLLFHLLLWQAVAWIPSQPPNTTTKRTTSLLSLSINYHNSSTTRLPSWTDSGHHALCTPAMVTSTIIQRRFNKGFQTGQPRTHSSCRLLAASSDNLNDQTAPSNTATNMNDPQSPTLPAPTVWVLQNDDDSSNTKTAKNRSNDGTFPSQSLNWIKSGSSIAADQTWNWSTNFVLQHNLCPWARASLETANALQVFVVTYNDLADLVTEHGLTDDETLQEIVKAIARRFETEILGDNELDDDGDGEDTVSPAESAAIYFLIFADTNTDDTTDESPISTSQQGSKQQPQQLQSHWMQDFGDYYSWFVDLEDYWLEEAQFSDSVTLAPFHPKWTFYDDNDTNDATDNEEDTSSIGYEKRSPYPTITFVSTRIIDQAGPAASNAVAEHNEEILLQKPVAFWSKEWQNSLKGNRSNNNAAQ